MTKHDHPLYWSLNNHPIVESALSMVSIYGYTTIPQTYEDLISMMPESDEVTPLIIMYAMLRSDDRYAYFHIQDGSLYLYTRDGFSGIDVDQTGFDDGLVCDAEIIYQFSPLYQDIPSMIDTSVSYPQDELDLITKKIALIERASMILMLLPCSEPDRSSP